MDEGDCTRVEPRPRRVVVATSANPEVVSRESFVQRLEGMSSSASSSNVACVNCHKERSHGHHDGNNSNNNNNSNSKRKAVGRHKGRGNNNNNNSNGSRRKHQQSNQQQHQYQHQQLKSSYSPIVVHLKNTLRSKRNLMSGSGLWQSTSVDADSDASSRSTDEDHWTGGISINRGEDEPSEVTSSSVSEDLSSSPETVSHLQYHYQHYHHARPFRGDRARKSFRGMSRIHHSHPSSKGPHNNGGVHQTSCRRAGKNLTAFITELEKVHRKEPARDIEINLNGNNASDNKHLLNYHSHCDCKDEELNNACKSLLKDVEIKRKNVAKSENVELICNDLYTSNEKLSEESTDESDTSDKASVLSSSDALSDDVGVGVPSFVSAGRNGRKFSAEELEELVEYTTGQPLLHFNCQAPSQCLSCMNAMSSYPYYYSYFNDGFESQQQSRFLYDVYAHDWLYHHYQYQHSTFHRHQQYHHRRFHHHRHHQHQRHFWYHQTPVQLHNHWIIQRPRTADFDKLTSVTGTEFTFDIEENFKNTFSTSSTSSSTTSLPSSSPTMMTTSSNTVVTVCANTAVVKSSKQPTSSKQRTSSQSKEPNTAKSDASNSSQAEVEIQNREDESGSVTVTATSASPVKRNRNKNNRKGHDPHKDCNLNDSVYMDLTGQDVTFEIFYPGDSDHLSWPSTSTSMPSGNTTIPHQTTGHHHHHHHLNTPSSFSIPSNVSYHHLPKSSSSGLATSAPLSTVSRHSRRSISSSSSSSSPSSSPPLTTDSSEDNGSPANDPKSYELAIPSHRPWITVGKADKEVPAAVFTVMCYNVLSDKLCTKAMYGYCPTWALSWDYRKKGIMNDIINGNADIITLQEVETEQYYGLFLPELQGTYDGVFLPKSRVRTMNSDKEKMSVDGCAIFYKKSKFEKVNEHHVEFSQLATKDGASNTDSDMINRVSTKDNIAIVAMLRTKPAAYDASPVPAPKGLSQVLMVSTAHIHWDPQLPDVKLVQTIMLIEELRKFIKEVSVQFRPNAPPPSVDAGTCSALPIILCGDFNSLPNSGVFEFLSKGKLNTRHKDFEGQNYKAFMKDRNENGILNHNFNLTSAYKDIIPFTNYTFDFKGVIDYIFYSGQHFRLHGVMGLQGEDWFKANKIVGCPHPFVPSDHFPLFAEFSLPDKSGQQQKPR